MKRILSILSLALVCMVSRGADTVLTMNAAGTNSVFSVGQTISQVTVAAGATNLTLALFDAPSTSLTYVRGAYATFNQYTTNIVTIFTNTGGVLQTNTNSGVYTYQVTNGNATNSFKLLTRLTVPANTTVTWTPINGASTTFGVLATNDAGIATATFTATPNF